MKKILYIDDDQQAGKLMRFYLQRENYDVLVCTDTKNARNVLAAEPIDAIITDIGMPGEDGISFYKWLQKHETYRNIPILLVSAHAMGFDEVLREHKDIFLSKPLFFPDLIERLDRMIGKNK